MNRFKKLMSVGIGATVAFSASLIMGFAGSANAVACYQYNANGFNTSQTPVFNNICNITSPLSSNQGNYNLGDETNFVRIRPDVSGSPLGSTNPPLTNSLSAACNSGDKFDIWTYIHNDAESQFNPDTGNGSAVAHNVKLTTDAPINKTGNDFNFSSSISASNAASVSDTTTLDCNGQDVKLTLVPGSVHFNNDLSQTTYGSLPDGTVNSTTPIGNIGTPGNTTSPEWSPQTGDFWGCWNYRVVIVYTVTVQKETPPPTPTPPKPPKPTPPKPTPQVTATCNLLSVLAGADRQVTVNQFKFTAENANFKSAVLDWGDGSSDTTVTDSGSVVGQTHQYGADGTYLVSAVVNFMAGDQSLTSGGSGTVCAETVTFSSSKPPVVTPPTTTTPAPTVTTPAPTQLVNTGPGSTIGLFAAVAAVSAVGYRWFLGRRLARQQ